MRTSIALRWALTTLVLLSVLTGTFGVAWGATKKKTTTTTTAPTRPAFSTASGTVAAIAGSSMEVQNPSTGQVTVSWTATTRFSQTITVAATQLAVGDCVTIVSSSTAKTGPMKAATVSLGPSAAGSCTQRFSPSGAAGGASPGEGQFAGRGFPTGSFPGNFRRNGSTANRFRAPKGRFASGQVISISGAKFVVKGFAPIRPASKKTKTTKSSTTSTTIPPKTVKTTVSFGSKTQFTTTESASPSNITVGICATALGPASQTGAVMASTISLRAPTGGTCTASGFGGFAGFAGRPGA